MAKSSNLKYLYYGAAIYLAYYLFKAGSGIKGIGASPKVKYKYLVVLYGKDANNQNNILLEKKYFTTVATSEQTARNRVRKKYPLPYETELYSSEVVSNIGNVLDTIKAKKKVQAMTDRQVVEEISTIFAYEMQDNDVNEADIYDNLKEARKQLIKHYSEIL